MRDCGVALVGVSHGRREGVFVSDVFVAYLASDRDKKNIHLPWFCIPFLLILICG